MDFILIGLTLSLLALNWGIYTRLTDASGVVDSLEAQTLGSKQEVYLSKVLSNLIASSVLFTVVIVVIMIYLPVIYSIKGGLLTYPFAYLPITLSFVNFAEMYLVSRPTARIKMSLMIKRAQYYNTALVILTTCYLYNAF